MDLPAARFLTSDEGARLLEAARDTRDVPAHKRVGALSGHGSAEHVRAALSQDGLRRRATARLPHAERLLFTEEGLEMATAWQVALNRAARWPRAPRGRLSDLLVDLGAGIGVDALAAAAAGRPVLAFERDPVRACLLRHNARELGLGARIEVREADVLEAAPEGQFAYLDPGRRSGGVRTRNPEAFEPPASTWVGLLGPFPAWMVKLPPGLPPELDLGDVGDTAFEVVSLDGRARETRLLGGPDFAGAPPRRALSLPAGRAIEGSGLPWPAARAPREGDLLLDPDPAVTLADLVGDLAAAFDLAPVHPRIAYLLGGTAAPGAPGHQLLVEAVLRPRAREVRQWLASRDIGRLTIRTRGVADSAAVWRRRLGPLRGRLEATVVFTRGPDDRWIALGGQEVAGPGGHPPTA